MHARIRHSRGLTLVELLVVLAIISLLATISVPLLARAGFFSSDADLAARTFYTQLRAAKIYATTFNVSAGLAYAVTTPTDSMCGAAVPAFDAFATVRSLKREELDPIRDVLTAGGVDPNVPVYVPLAGVDGEFAVFGKGTGVLLYSEGAINPCSDIINAPEDLALSNIVIFDPRTNTVMDIRGAVDLPAGLSAWGEVNAPVFPAHIFSPSGSITPEQTLQRITLRVGLLPDEDPADRFVLDSQTGAPLTDATGALVGADAEIELYTAIGRIKVIS